MANIRVEVSSEEATTTDPARVKIYHDEKLVAEVIGTVEQKQGADGKLYPCVTLRKK